MIVTVTERGVFKRCRRRWDYSSNNRRALAPLVGSPNLSFGSVIHETLAGWFHEPTADPVALYAKAANDALEKIKTRYREVVGVNVSEVELADTYEALALGWSVIRNYAQYWGGPVPEGYELIAFEQQVVTDVPGTPHQLEGRFDGILRHLSSGLLFILEHKTYRNRPNPYMLQSNDQMLAYTWVLQQLGIGPVGGILYNGLWKREAPPKGGTLADLFLRFPIKRTDYERSEFEKHLRAEISEMGAEDIDDRLYPNRRWEGCWDCGFEKLCAMQSKGENWQLYLETNFTKRERDTDLEGLNGDE